LTEPYHLPIDGVLDLHTFQPRDVKTLIPAYIEACLEQGVFSLRIIHGKGTGTLCVITHSILKQHPAVESYRPDSGSGSWGATLVNLRRPQPIQVTRNEK
jgi:DNA-nicking Smr family endonuclease